MGSRLTVKSVIKWLLLASLVLFTLFYLVGVYFVATDKREIAPRETAITELKTIAIFGASGTAGDGILKAALESPAVEKVYVVTRRVTQRMENADPDGMSEGMLEGKLELIIHQDYMDYSNMIERLKDVDTVFWAIGISSLGADEQTYAKIHVDFPMQFVNAWQQVNQQPKLFQFISSSDISEQSDTTWVQQKIRAEKSLFGFAEATNMRVIAYRPDYIGPTEQQATLLESLLYGFFKPVGAAVTAEQIGQAMIEITQRSAEFNNGDKLTNSKIKQLSRAYQQSMLP
jgi:hypothetical protein